MAIKCMKTHFNSLDQVNNLREVQALRRLSPHPHVVKLLEILYDEPTGRLALVFELMEQNLYEWIRGRKQHFPEAKVKAYMYQLAKALEHMHRNGIFHRDIKPENVLLADDALKLADYGSCRGIYSKQPFTEYISTRWYRAPECLITDGYYSYKMDIWGMGCVFFEVLALFPLFPGTNELDQINKIHNIMGTPSAEILAKFKHLTTHMEINFASKAGDSFQRLLPQASQQAKDLIAKMLIYDPDQRISAKDILRDPYFRDLADAEMPVKLAASPSMMRHSPGVDESADGEQERSGEMLPPIKNPQVYGDKQRLKQVYADSHTNLSGVVRTKPNPYAKKKPAKKSYLKGYF